MLKLSSAPMQIKHDSTLIELQESLTEKKQSSTIHPGSFTPGRVEATHVRLATDSFSVPLIRC